MTRFRSESRERRRKEGISWDIGSITRDILTTAANAEDSGIFRVLTAAAGFIFTLLFVLKFNGGIYLGFFAALIAAGVPCVVFEPQSRKNLRALVEVREPPAAEV